MHDDCSGVWIRANIDVNIYGTEIDNIEKKEREEERRRRDRIKHCRRLP